MNIFEMKLFRKLRIRHVLVRDFIENIISYMSLVYNKGTMRLSVLLEYCTILGSGQGFRFED